MPALPGPYDTDVEVPEDAYVQMRDFQALLPPLTDEQRWALLHELAGGFCWDCGRKTDRYGCYCQCDD